MNKWAYRSGFITGVVMGIIGLVIIGVTYKHTRDDITNLQEQVVAQNNYPVGLAERVLTLQTRVDNLEAKLNAKGQVNTGTLADRLAGLDQQVQTIDAKVKVTSRLIGTDTDPRLYTNLIDPWSVYLVQTTIAEKALAVGNTQRATEYTLLALSNLGSYCHERVMPQSYLAPELQALVTDVYSFKTVNEIKGGDGNTTWVHINLKDVGC